MASSVKQRIASGKRAGQKVLRIGWVLAIQGNALNANDPAGSVRRAFPCMSIGESFMANSLKTMDRPQHPYLERSLPQHGLLYFDHLIAEFQTKISQGVDQELKVIIE